MKTITIKRIATFFTIVTIIAATNTTFAQRRSNHYKNDEARMEKKRETGKNSTSKKNAIKSNRDNARRTTQSSKLKKVTYNRNSHQPAINEKKHTPGKELKGSYGHLSSKAVKRDVPSSHMDKNFYHQHNHRNYKHWDKHWESYHWSVNSWTDYYNGYYPYSFKFHKFYYIHPKYGHVIRKFHRRPDYFVHNKIRYYNYNGHLFRYFKGVGYVLTDIPYGMVFQKIPAGYERVYINGIIYFRIGNLFLEMNPYGYSLVHYPERYFAVKAGF